jgi:hypothetical protein
MKVDFTALPPRMVRLEAYAIEVVLSLSSLWATWVLLAGKRDPFTAFRTAFALASRLGSEEHWAYIALIGAVTKLIGLSLSRTPFICTALVLRLLGIAIAGAFWFLLGFSTVYGNPNTLFGFPIMLLGASAWWLLIRFPTLPDSTSERSK